VFPFFPIGSWFFDSCFFLLLFFAEILVAVSVPSQVLLFSYRIWGDDFSFDVVAFLSNYFFLCVKLPLAPFFLLLVSLDCVILVLLFHDLFLFFGRPFIL